MSTDALETSVLEILRRIVPVASTDLDPAVPFRDQFEMDSLDFLSFIVALEKEHGVKIPEVRYPLCASLAGAARVLTELRTG